MTYEEATLRLSEMKNRYDDGFSSLDRSYLDSLYFTLFGKVISNKGCGNCYRDAYLEINVKLKKLKTMPKKSEFVLKAGAVITFFGEQKCFTNANMTDEAAIRFLSLNPMNERLFEKLPYNWKDRLGEVETISDFNQESDKDEIISRLNAEIEMLKEENKSLKAKSASTKKGKKKSDVEKTIEDAPSEESFSKEAPIEEESAVENDDFCEDPVIEE